MIKVDTSGVGQFNRELTLAFAVFEREISAAFAAWAMKVFRGITEGTPQWSSDLVRNWNYSINQPDYSYSETPQKELMKDLWMGNLLAPLQRGDQFGVSFAIARAQTSRQPTWRDMVFITNNTPVAPAAENQTVYIRPVNLIDGRVAMIKYTIDNAGRYQP